MTENRALYEQSISFFHTQDLEATTTFYEQLGLPLKLDQGLCRIFQVSNDGFIGFCTHQKPASPEGVIITLVTSKVEEVCAQLKAQGVVFEKGPQSNEKFHITHAFLRDPNGYLVEIQRFDDPRWIKSNPSE